MVELPDQEIHAIIRVFTEAMNNGTLPLCGIDDNLKTVAMTCAAVESCKTVARVNIQAMLEGAKT